MKPVSIALILIAALALSGCATNRGGRVIDLTNAKTVKAPQIKAQPQQSAQSGNVADFTR